MSNETYADLAALKDWIGAFSPDVVSDGNRDDYALGTALIAASRAIDNWTNRRFWRDSTDTSFYAQATTGQTVWIPDLSDNDFTVAVDRDFSKDFATTLSAENFASVKPHNPPYRSITFRGIALAPTDVVRITGRFGWPEVPAPIEMATLILAARYFKRQDSPEGVLGSSLELGPVRITTRDSDVASLIAPYRIHGWA